MEVRPGRYLQDQRHNRLQADRHDPRLHQGESGFGRTPGQRSLLVWHISIPSNLTRPESRRVSPTECGIARPAQAECRHRSPAKLHEPRWRTARQAGPRCRRGHGSRVRTRMMPCCRKRSLLAGRMLFDVSFHTVPEDLKNV